MTSAPSFVSMSVKIDNSPAVNVYRFLFAFLWCPFPFGVFLCCRFIAFSLLFIIILSFLCRNFKICSFDFNSPPRWAGPFPPKLLPFRWISFELQSKQKRTAITWFQFWNRFSLNIFRSTILTVDNFVSSAWELVSVKDNAASFGTPPPVSTLFCGY